MDARKVYCTVSAMDAKCLAGVNIKPKAILKTAFVLISYPTL